MPKVNADSKILHEKPKSNNNNIKIDEDKEASREEQPGDVDNNLNENVELDPRAARIQELKDIAAGKYDDEDAINEDLQTVKDALRQNGKLWATQGVGAYAGHKIAEKLGGGWLGKAVGRGLGAAAGGLAYIHRDKIKNALMGNKRNIK